MYSISSLYLYTKGETILNESVNDNFTSIKDIWHVLAKDNSELWQRHLLPPPL